MQSAAKKEERKMAVKRKEEKWSASEGKSIRRS